MTRNNENLNTKYETRIVAFVDILGFKEILKNTVDKAGNENSQNVQIIISAYNHIKEILINDSEWQTEADKMTNISIFSDCIVISFPYDAPSQTFFILDKLSILTAQLLWKYGILCRGGLALGKLIHTNEFLFGPALVEAYLLESKAAMYPRIIIDNSVLIEVSKYSSVDNTPEKEIKEIKNYLLLKDSDGMYYIDYFKKIRDEFNDSYMDYYHYLVEMRIFILDGIRKSIGHDKVDIRVKYYWMRDKFNKTILSLHKENPNDPLYQKLKIISQHRN